METSKIRRETRKRSGEIQKKGRENGRENDAKFKYTNDCREGGGVLSAVLQEGGNPEECKIVIAN